MKPTNLSEDCERVDALQLFQGFLPVQPHLLFFFLLAAVFCGSCSSFSASETTETDIVQEPPSPGSVPVLNLEFRDGCRIFDDAAGRIERLDVFIYKDEEIRTLESHLRIEGGSRAGIETSGGRKLVAAFANVPGTFGLSSLQRYESLCEVRMDFAHDRTEQPVMEGRMTVEMPDSGDVRKEMVLEPLMSRIVVERIDIGAGDLLTADRPVLSVRGARSSLPLAAGTVTEEREESFPERCNPTTSVLHDIGQDGCQLWESIYFYPPADSLRLEYEAGGKKRSLSRKLETVGSNSTTVISLEIE